MSVNRNRKKVLLFSALSLSIVLLFTVVRFLMGHGNAQEEQIEFGLFLRTFHKKKNLYDNIFVRSLRYFWPHNSVPLTVVLDDERVQDHNFGQEISLRYPYPDVRYEPAVDPRLYGYHGHLRQQRSMFYAEKYTNYKYVGFVDTDTLFVTTATLDLMFENGKPIVIGQYGKAANEYWAEIGMGTVTMFKTLEVMRCMSYFPVVIRLDHLIELRKYVEKIHNKPFDEVFAKISPRSRFSQFNLMCQYIWYFHREEYVFRMQERTNNGNWKGENNSPYRQPYEFYKNMRQEMRNPIPRTSIHYRYHKGYKNETVYREVLTRALCYSGGFKVCEEKCKHFNENDLQRELFQFEYSDWSWDARCYDAQLNHYSIVKEYFTTDARNRIRNGCNEIDHVPFEL